MVTAGALGPDGRSTPHATTHTWRSAGMQQMVDAVRGAGARQPIIANGLDWANNLSGWLPTGRPARPASS